ncbi:MAG: S-adenosylmethionine synthetase, partial [Firmicutes bacterium]|nr:S-adenosylmethionine synthetase [Bacillota bacterium]
EAAAGKNSVSHVGKIYTVLTHRIAQRVYEEVPGVRECYIWLCSQIGEPVDRPKVAAAQVILERGVRRTRVLRQVREVVDRELQDVRSLIQDLAAGKYAVV